MKKESNMLIILFLASNPNRTGKLRLDKECREIKEKIKLSENSNQFNFISEWAVRVKNLLDFVTEKNPDIIHFSGHGEDSDIILEGDDGNPVSVSKSAIVRLLGRCKNLKLVVFNTCYSVSFAQETIKKINFAIGMDGSINDDSAIAFGYRFYSSLGTGRSVEDSYEDALTEIELNGLSNVDTPQFYVKNGIDKNIALIDKNNENNSNNDAKINIKDNYGQVNSASGDSIMNVTQNVNNNFDKKKEQ